MVGLASKAAHLPGDLTQIEMRKLELARAMASEPRLLIADEAMAGLSHQEVDDILALLLRLNEQGVDTAPTTPMKRLKGAARPDRRAVGARRRPGPCTGPCIGVRAY